MILNLAYFGGLTVLLDRFSNYLRTLAVKVDQSSVEINYTRHFLASVCLLHSGGTLGNASEGSGDCADLQGAQSPTRRIRFNTSLLALHKTLCNGAKVCRIIYCILRRHLITHHQPTIRRHRHNGNRARSSAVHTHEWLEATTIRGLGTGEQAPARKSW